MKKYYVNNHAQFNGDHEVHDETCPYLPLITNKLPLGEFDSCAPAVTAAKMIYKTADGCFYCCKPCHTT